MEKRTIAGKVAYIISHRDRIPSFICRYTMDVAAESVAVVAIHWYRERVVVKTQLCSCGYTVQGRPAGGTGHQADRGPAVTAAPCLPERSHLQEWITGWTLSFDRAAANSPTAGGEVRAAHV